MGGDTSRGMEWEKAMNCSLGVFGSIAHVHVPDERRMKLDDKSQPFISVGYEANLKGCKLRDVAFDEEGEWDFSSIREGYIFYEMEVQDEGSSHEHVLHEPVTPPPSLVASRTSGESSSTERSSERAPRMRSLEDIYESTE
ncbi:hypothetical protein V2J09_016091 [Rumex salicifolius]